MKYKVIEVDVERMIPYNIIRTDEDGKEWAIPADENNSDYQAYLKSLEPEVVEEPVEGTVEQAPVEVATDKEDI